MTIVEQEMILVVSQSAIFTIFRITPKSVFLVLPCPEASGKYGQGSRKSAFALLIF